MDWIDEIDEELSALREAEARIYHSADLSGDLDASGLQEIAERRRHLLAREQTESHAASLAEACGDPLIRRKARLLGHMVAMAHIDDAPKLAGIRHELEQAQQRYKGEMRTAVGMRAYLNETEQAAREGLKIANRLAREQGFPDYVEAKLFCQEWSRRGLIRALLAVQRACRRECTEALRGLDAAGLSQAELDRAMERKLIPAEEQFPASRLGEAAAGTLALFGLRLDALPIKIEILDLPYPGAVHTLKIREDVRVVINGKQNGFRRYCLFFHELGHALYYSYVPDSALLLDNRIGREGLAELWCGLIARDTWLRRFSGLDGSEIERLLAASRLYEAYMLMTFVREADFELKVYGNPEADFHDLWNAATKECFGFEDNSGLYSEFVFLYPLDIKDYIVAHLIRRALISELESRFGSDLNAPAVFRFIAESYYEPANSLPWPQRFAVCDDPGRLLRMRLG